MTRREWTELQIEPRPSGTVNIRHIEAICNRCSTEFKLAENGSNFAVLDTEWTQWKYVDCALPIGSVDLCPKCSVDHRKFMCGAKIVEKV